MVDVAATEVAKRYGGPAILAPNPTNVRPAVEVIGLSGLGSVAQLTWALHRSRRAFMIGADILDGAYNSKTIMKRLRMAQAAHMLGAKVRVVGCSFSANADLSVTAFLKRSKWLEILARDPVSQARLETALDRQIELVADTAFLLRPEATTQVARNAIDWMKDQNAGGRRVLALNVSGLLFARMEKGSLETFCRGVANWIDGHKNIAALVVAHDRRPGNAGDVATCDVLDKAIRERAPDRCHYVREDIQAWDAKEIAGHLDMAFVCRMHFAIACLGRGVPPLSLVTMGKFEGLMSHFGLEGLTLDPAAAMDVQAVGAALDDLKMRAPQLRVEIEKALPRMKELSARNYQSL